MQTAGSIELAILVAALIEKGVSGTHFMRDGIAT
jgi:hypothetical protein